MTPTMYIYACVCVSVYRMSINQSIFLATLLSTQSFRELHLLLLNFVRFSPTSVGEENNNSETDMLDYTGLVHWQPEKEFGHVLLVKILCILF